MIQCVLLIRMLHEFFVRLYRLTENRMCFCCAQKKFIVNVRGSTWLEHE